MESREFIKNLVFTLGIERTKNIRNGAYGYIQRSMAYNSNKIEGSTLTERHTADLFMEGVIYARVDDVYKPKDIEEMRGHFMMFNYMLDTLQEPLSEDIIKGFHKQLKQGVFEDFANGYNIGEYKGRSNQVSNIKTSAPQDVTVHMRELLLWYSKQQVNLQTLAEFHYRYEKIHPFQDGNGRTGRIILFRECLRNDIEPFIILDSKRAMYMRGLDEAGDGDFSTLFSLFENMQQELKRELEGMLISHLEDPKKDCKVKKRDSNLGLDEKTQVIIDLVEQAVLSKTIAAQQLNMTQEEVEFILQHRVTEKVRLGVDEDEFKKLFNS